MSRYIDADAYAAEMKTRQDACKETMDAAKEDDNWELYAHISAKFSIFVEAKLTLDNMPTVDAVPVVRCKDCIEYRDSVGACHYFNYESTDEMDFCSHGIRADGERRSE